MNVQGRIQAFSVCSCSAVLLSCRKRCHNRDVESAASLCHKYRKAREVIAIAFNRDRNSGCEVREIGLRISAAQEWERGGRSYATVP